MSDWVSTTAYASANCETRVTAYHTGSSERSTSNNMFNSGGIATRVPDVGKGRASNLDVRCSNLQSLKPRQSYELPIHPSYNGSRLWVYACSTRKSRRQAFVSQHM